MDSLWNQLVGRGTLHRRRRWRRSDGDMGRSSCQIQRAKELRSRCTITLESPLQALDFVPRYIPDPGRSTTTARMSPAPGESSISRAEAEGSYEELRERLSFVRQHLESLGIRVPAGSRLDTYERALRQLSQLAAGEGEQIGVAVRDMLHDAILECEQFLPSIIVLAQQPEVDGWRAVAARAIGGHASSRTEDSTTPARDAQFELFVAALARRANYEVRFAEPDLILQLAGYQPWAVAVKRVKSHSAFLRRLRQGSKQIREAGLQGIVAIQLGFFAGVPIRAENMVAACDQLRAETREYVSRHLFEFRREVNLSWCFGLLVFSSKPTFLTEPASLAVTLAVYTCNLCDESDPRCIILERLTEGLPAIPWQL
jgi:hypothetical protein